MMGMVSLGLLFLALPQLVSKVLPNDQGVYAEVKSEISSNRSHVGDPVKLVVLEDWHGADAGQMIPAKAVLLGRVSAARKHSRQTPATLSIVVDSVEFNGKNLLFYATVASVVVTEMERHQATELVLRGTNQGLAAAGSPGEAVHVFPKDCSVERSDDPSAMSTMVCQKRNVSLRKSARVLLVSLSAFHD